LGGLFAGVSGDALLVAGGTNFRDSPPWEGGKKSWYDAIYALSPGHPSWRAVGKLPQPLAYGVSVDTDRGVLCAGGADAQGHYAGVCLLQWHAGTVTLAPLPPLPTPSAYLCGARLGSVIYLAGGTDHPAATRALRSFWAMDLAAPRPAWRELEPWPGPGRILAVAGVQGGAFYLFSGAALEPDAGGAPIRRYLSDAYRFTPGRGWQTVAAPPRPMVAAPSPAMAIGQSHLFVCSGDDGAKAGLTPPTPHPGFPSSILAYHTITDTWVSMGNTPAPHVTTPAVNWRGRWVIPSGEIRPGVRSPEVWSFQP
jgi:N-acetylneuraminic acid mutarotase